MKNKLTVLIVCFLSVILMACTGESSKSDTLKITKFKNDIEKGDVISARNSTLARSNLALTASSFVFEKATRTIEEISISDIRCEEENNTVCSTFLRLANDNGIMFKSNSEAMNYNSSNENEFDKQVKGLLYFKDIKVNATLFYLIRPSKKGTYFLGQIVIPEESFEKIDTEVTIYVKGRSN